MSAWRKIAFACVVCSPAIFVVGSLATAIETQSGSADPLYRPQALQLAEDAATPAPAAAAGYDPVAASAYTVTDEDIEKVSPEVAEDAKNQPVFTEEYLNDAANVEAGKEIWVNTCAGCHGARAYPGKAPKLRPKRYTPGFIFHQATFGGKKMPPFGDIFTREERMAVVAWVLNKNFAP